MKGCVLQAFFAMMLQAVLATRTVTLLFVGDISFSGPVRYYVEHDFNSYNDTLSDVAPYIREADISVANFESPVITKDVYRYKYKGYKTVILDSSPESVPALRFAGFKAVTLANNHLNDFGSEGVRSSVQALEDVGIKYFGVNYGKYDSSQEPLILESKGIKIGFLGYCDQISSVKNCTEVRMEFTAGPAIYTKDVAASDIAKLKPKVDIIVVFLHWGLELSLKPVEYQVEITKYLMSLGVHVIIGAHPHVLEPHCRHGNKVAAFSLGNFLFPPGYLPRGNNPALYGRLGKKPDKVMIGFYENFVLGNCEALKYTRLFRVAVTKSGVESAEYLPAKLKFDKSRKLLHPAPRFKDTKWIRVCGDEDNECQECFSVGTKDQSKFSNHS